MTHSIRLIVLSLTRIKENSLVLHTLSAEYGRRSFLIGVTAKSPMALFQPLNILDAEVVENPKSDLWRLKSISTLYPLSSIRMDIYKGTMALFMSEVLYRAVHEGDGGSSLFDWACRSILTLDSIQEDFSNFHIRFLLEFATVMGFSADIDSLAPFAGNHLEQIRLFVGSGFADSMLIALNGRSRSEIASSLLKYISHHIEAPLNVNSLKVLGEVFR